MKTIRITICTAVAVACGFLVLGSPRGFAQDGAGLPEIRQQPNVDETLFLVRVLESLYEQWPSDAASPNAFVAAAGELRKEALRYSQHIQAKNLDADLGARFGDVVANLDAYSSFLANLDVIQEEAVKRLQQDSFQSGYKGGYAGGTTLATLSQSDDISSGEAVAAAVIVGGITWAVDAWEKADKRDRAQQQAVEAEARRIGDLIQASLMQAQTTARELARKYKWGPSEIGWELSDDQAEILARLSKTGDTKGLTAIAERQVSLRPRDPFPRLSRNLLKASASENDVATLASVAKDTYLCASLIPSGVVYDDYRLGCVAMAAALSGSARFAEIRNAIDPFGSTPNSRVAVQMWRKAIDIAPSDANGELRQQLAFTLMCDNSLSEAQGMFKEIAPLRQADPTFCFNYASLLSRCKDGSHSLAWLEASIKAGFGDVIWASNAPYLKHLRETHAQEFGNLVTPKYEWSVTDDWVWDDIILKNTSAFPITGVSLSVTLKQSATQNRPAYQKTLDLSCDRLGPSEVKTWVDVVDGAEGAWDNSSTASLRCDQNR
jgi:hypothetical protein